MEALKLPPSQFRSLVLKTFRTYHHLRCCPNIVNCDCEHFELEKHSLLPYFSSNPLYYRMEDRQYPIKDPALELVWDKYLYNKRLMIIKASYLRAQKNKVVRKYQKEGFVSGNVCRCVKHMQTDPDPDFQGYYNWYYTGGCMDVVQLKGYQYIFHVIGENMDVLEVSCYDAIRTTCKLKFKQPIYELCYERQRLVVRCRSSVYLYEFNEKGMRLELIMRCKTKKAFIAAKVDRKSQLVSLDSDHVLRVVPRNSKNSSKLFNLKEYFNGAKDNWAKDNWAHFTILWNRYCVLVNRSWMLIINMQRKFIKAVNILQTGMFAECSSITGVWDSKLDDDLIYLATTHEIFAIKVFLGNVEPNQEDEEEEEDEKKRKSNNLPFKICIRWVHQLQSVPLILKTILLKGDVKRELIYISSLHNNETKVLLIEKSLCNSDGDPDEQRSSGYHSYHPPFKPIDMETAFESCSQLGLFLETKYDFKRRLELSTIGLGMFLDENKSEDGEPVINLLALNSIGDIYHQTLTTGKPDEEHFLTEMRQTKQQLIEKQGSGKENPLIITGYENIKGLFEAALSSNESTETAKEGKNEEKEDDAGPKAKRRKYKWNRPIGKLRKYKDVLSKDLLAIWDVSDDDEDEDDDEKTGLFSSKYLEPEDKVSNWLQSTYIQPAGHDTTNGFLEDTEMDNKDDSKALLQDSLVKEEGVTSSQELPRRKSMSSQPKKKKSRLLGF